MTSIPLGPTVARIALGLALLAHSAYLKLFVFGLAGTAAYFDSIGLYAGLAYVVTAVEIVTGVALLAGVQTRWAAAAAIPVLLGATWAHWQNGWLFTNAGGGWEYPLFLTAIAVSILLSDYRLPAAATTSPSTSTTA